MKYFNYFFFAALVSLTPAAFAMNDNRVDGDKKQELDDIEMKDMKNNKRKANEADLNLETTDEPEKKKRKVLKLEYRTNPVVNNSNLDLDLYGDVLESNNNININTIVVQQENNHNNQEIQVIQPIIQNEVVQQENHANQDSLCLICQEALDMQSNNVITLSCNHSYDTACLREWFNECIDNGRVMSCPMCRRESPASSLNNTGLEDLMNGLEERHRLLQQTLRHRELELNMARMELDFLRNNQRIAGIESALRHALLMIYSPRSAFIMSIVFYCFGRLPVHIEQNQRIGYVIGYIIGILIQGSLLYSLTNWLPNYFRGPQ